MKGREKATQEGGEDAPNLLQVRSQCPRQGSGQTCHSPPNKGSDHPAPQVVTPATETDGEGRARPEQLQGACGSGQALPTAKRVPSSVISAEAQHALPRLLEPL